MTRRPSTTGIKVRESGELFFYVAPGTIRVNNLGYAAWYEKLLLDEGEYPVTIIDRDNTLIENVVGNLPEAKYVGLPAIPGEIIERDTRAHFGGVAVSDGNPADTAKIGQRGELPSTVVYGFMVKPESLF